MESKSDQAIIKNIDPKIGKGRIFRLFKLLELTNSFLINKVDEKRLRLKFSIEFYEKCLNRFSIFMLFVTELI